MRGVLLRASALALGATVSACASMSGEDGGPTVSDPKVVVADQSRPVVFVPIVVFKSNQSDRMLRDTYAALPTLEDCETAARVAAEADKPAEYEDMSLYETACFEVAREGGQTKHLVE